MCKCVKNPNENPGGKRKLAPLKGFGIPTDLFTPFITACIKAGPVGRNQLGEKVATLQSFQSIFLMAIWVCLI